VELDDAYKGNWLGPAQHYFARHHARRNYDALLAGLDDSTLEGLIAKARLWSIAGQGALARLEMLPTARCPVLPDGDFRLAMQRRLGLPNLPRRSHSHLFLWSLLGEHRLRARSHMPQPECTARAAP
jgi:hypothetical protein